MSIQVAERVWEFSRHKGSALLVLVAISGYAHGDGSGAWPSEGTLAKRTRLSVRQVRRIIAGKLVPSGELRVEPRPGRTHLMTVLTGDNLSGAAQREPGAAVRATPDAVMTGGSDISASTPDTARSDEPYLTVPEPSFEPSAPEGARVARTSDVEPRHQRLTRGAKNEGSLSDYARCRCGDVRLEHGPQAPFRCHRDTCRCPAFRARQ